MLTQTKINHKNNHFFICFVYRIKNNSSSFFFLFVVSKYLFFIPITIVVVIPKRMHVFRSKIAKKLIYSFLFFTTDLFEFRKIITYPITKLHLLFIHYD